MARSSERASEILTAPLVSEKARGAGERGVYVFKVKKDANKIAISRAIFELYGFRPRKINLVKIYAKKKFLRGERGKKPGYKKAYVYLKPGEKIEVA